jgi:hypothetical protein
LNSRLPPKRSSSPPLGDQQGCWGRIREDDVEVDGVCHGGDDMQMFDVDVDLLSRSSNETCQFVAGNQLPRPAALQIR